MGSNIFGVLQRIGRSFMLPVALLPVAGLLLGVGGSFTNETLINAYGLSGVLGEGTTLNLILQIMSKTGDVIFGNLPILFAMGIALGMAKKEKEVATLAAAIGYFVMHAATAALVAHQIATNPGVVAADAALGAANDAFDALTKGTNLPDVFANAKAGGAAVLSSFFDAHPLFTNAFAQVTVAQDALAAAKDSVFNGGQLATVLGLQSLQSGVFGGIVVGLGVAALHNKFYKVELPTAFAFFSGTRFVPIIVTLVYLVVGCIMFAVWPVVQNGLSAAGQGIQGAGLFGTFLFGLVKRLLIPFGLHHVWYLPFWQTELGGTWDYFSGTMITQNVIDATVAANPGFSIPLSGIGADGAYHYLSAGLMQTIEAANEGLSLQNNITEIVSGGQKMFFHQLAHMGEIAHFDSGGTKYFTGEFLFMMFGFPGGALAMYKCSKPENRTVAGGLLFSAAITSFCTGITEPIEFSFLFVAPLLFGVHVVLGGIAYALAEALNITIGVTFSAGLIDLAMFGVLPGQAKTNWLLVIPFGIIYFLLYFVVFSFLIKKFDFKTPGREEAGEEIKLHSKADYNERKGGGASSGGAANAGDELSINITIGLAGKANITDVDCCATRLRITVKDASKVDQARLKVGAAGVVCKGNGIQVIYGPRVTIIKANLEDFLESPAADRVLEMAADVPAIAETPAAKTGSKKATVVYSPLEGDLIALSEVEDEVFSEGTLGEGSAVIPSAGIVKAPFDGTITQAFETGHAIGLLSEDGVEVLIHVGLDTVKLKGDGFDVRVKEGDKVKKGQVINVFDIAKIKAAGYPTVTPVIVTNTDDYETVVAAPKGKVTFGDKIVEVR